MFVYFSIRIGIGEHVGPCGVKRHPTKDQLVVTPLLGNHIFGNRTSSFERAP